MGLGIPPARVPLADALPHGKVGDFVMSRCAGHAKETAIWRQHDPHHAPPGGSLPVALRNSAWAESPRLWQERAFDRSPGSLLADLAVLAEVGDADDDRLAKDGDADVGRPEAARLTCTFLTLAKAMVASISAVVSARTAEQTRRLCHRRR
jgi:hypothetical protein